MVNRLKLSLAAQLMIDKKRQSARAGHQRWRGLRAKLVQLPMADVMPKRPLNNKTSFEDRKMVSDI